VIFNFNPALPAGGRGVILLAMRANHEPVAAAGLARSRALSRRVGPVSWERMIRAVEKVRERLRRAAAALEKAGVPYCA